MGFGVGLGSFFSSPKPEHVDVARQGWCSCTAIKEVTAVTDMVLEQPIAKLGFGRFVCGLGFFGFSKLFIKLSTVNVRMAGGSN